jgi:glycosyltransferase involved in cell wall biosynthesis
MRILTALPVYNEVRHVTNVLSEVTRYASDVLVVDDGSRDGTSALLQQRTDIALVTHAANRGYGAALQSAFVYAQEHGYDYLITIDCDGQHQPRLIPEFVRVLQGLPTHELPFNPVCRTAVRPIDIVSGSRYLCDLGGTGLPPVDRRRINVQITDELNCCLGLNLTDAFCGFKAYRVAALNKLLTKETGYAMPLELWVRAAHAQLRVEELPVPLVYLEEKRSFGGALDDPDKRLAYYHTVIDRTLAEVTGTPVTLQELRSQRIKSGAESTVPPAPHWPCW